MRVINKTTGGVLADKAGSARTFFARLKGLLGRRTLASGEGLVIIPCLSIHTFGMRFPIDVVFFDGSNRAVAVLSGVRPYRVTRLYPAAAGVLELPAGVLGSSPVQPGDELEFQP